MQAFANLPIGLPAPPAPDTRYVRHLFTIASDEAHCDIDRDAFLQAMNEHGIGMGVHYLSVPEHPYYRDRFGWRLEQWPHAMRIGRQTVSLPLSPKFIDADTARVIRAVTETVGG